MLPLRRDDLLIEELEQESVVYDPVTHKGHCLNQTARLVLQFCDGKTSVGEIASRLEAELKTSVDQQVVWAALADLSKAQLLKRCPTNSRKNSRRDLGRRVVAAGVAAVIVSMVAPTAAMAATVGAGGCCCPGDTCVNSNCVGPSGAAGCPQCPNGQIKRCQ